jgi:hypothetical protein
VTDLLDGDDMALLQRFVPRPETRLAGRRARETRPLAGADRRLVTTDDVKSMQINIRVTPMFKRQMLSFADAQGLTIVGVIEKAVAEYMMRAQVRGHG